MESIVIERTSVSTWNASPSLPDQPSEGVSQPIVLAPDTEADSMFPLAAPDGTPGAPARRSRRRTIGAVVAGALCLTVVAGGAAVAANMWYSSSGDMPESVVP